MCACQCSQRPEESVRFPGAVVKDCRDPPDVGATNKTWSSAREVLNHPALGFLMWFLGLMLV